MEFAQNAEIVKISFKKIIEVIRKSKKLMTVMVKIVEFSQYPQKRLE